MTEEQARALIASLTYEEKLKLNAFLNVLEDEERTNHQEG